jgi:hypothetical protein
MRLRDWSRGAPYWVRDGLMLSRAVYIGAHVSVRTVRCFHLAICGKRRDKATWICSEEKRVLKLVVPKSIPTLDNI